MHLQESNEYVSSSAKYNENVERKNKNENEMHDKSRKCDNFIGSLYNIYKTIPIKLICVWSI